MTTTYSPNLAISLIGTGDQAGTWGTTTNTNLGTLIEQAISGYTTYSCTGGTDTITIPNGATGVARNMYLEFTGVGGGTVLVPANKKLYFVYNNTASGAVTIKVSGQTGVSVPNGAKVLLVNNGTDVVQAINYIQATLVGNVTGNLTGNVTGNVSGTATNATNLVTSNFTVSESGGQLVFSYGATQIATLDSSGNFTAIGAVAAGT